MTLKVCIPTMLVLVGVLVLCFATSPAQARPAVLLYKDPNQPVENRVEDLLRRMTLAEKIGQMTQLARDNLTADVVRDYYIGSVLSGGGSVPKENATIEDWIDMVNDFQTGAMATRLAIPYIYGIDAVHGHNNVYKATIFPHNVGLGVTRDPELVKRIAAATALECRATGIPYAFAPCIAVCRDPRWGRCYESYSEDHSIVQQMTSAVSGFQGDVSSGHPEGYPYLEGQDKVVACAKHFVGDGGTNKGIDENNTVTSWKGLLDVHMPAYPDIIKKGVGTVMISYSSWNGVKMHANRDLVTNYLKGFLGFKGIVISDWEGIDRITSPPHANYTYSVEVGINAGLDMIMVPYNQTEFIHTLTFLVEKNYVPMSRIDDAVRRILRVKFVAGLFENPFADLRYAHELGSRKHRDLAREAVRKSLVLLKNGEDPSNPLPPLPKKASKILVAGTHSDNLGLQCGGWTITWNGEPGNNITTGTTILSGIKSVVDSSTKVEHRKKPSSRFVKASEFDYAIIVVGEPPYAEMQGDNDNLTIPEPGLKTIYEVCSNVKCVVVLISGRPLVIEPHLPKIDAFVAAWLPGTEGQGISDVLFGDFGFTGKLARTWFRTVDQLPMNVGDRKYDPLFPFGFGLETKPIAAGMH